MKGGRALRRETREERPRRGLVGLFTLTTFASAGLLFLVEPMAGRLLLPLLGGSPAVWNTTQLFFQAALLAGYAYAHLLGSLRSPRMQAAVHAVLLAAGLLALPIALPRAVAAPPAAGLPILWLLARLAAMTGAPFFVLAATGPLLQRWLARTDDPAAEDPYFLYAASNAGSLLALLGYPVLELALGLKAQGRAWAMGYAACAILGVACGGLMTRRRPLAAPAPAAERLALAWSTRARWMFLAFVPSSLMLGCTQYLTTDIASVPLLWILPLSVYLVTFIVAFARRAVLPSWAAGGLVATVLALAATFLFAIERPVWLILALHLAALFFAGWVAHGRLAAERPDPASLTEFYLWIAAGGVLGGVWNAVVSPLVFKVVLEYPLALFLALLLAPPRRRESEGRRGWLTDLARAAIVLLAFASLVSAMRVVAPQLMETRGRMVLPLLEWAITSVPLLFLIAAIGRRRRFALAFAVVVVIVQGRLSSSERLLHLERTFFGVHRVTTDVRGEWHRLSHGTTRHGLQYTDPRLAARPMMYYYPTGPIGDVFRTFLDDPAFTRVGIVGLGAGSLAAYAQPGRHFTYFEIDPAVQRIAEDEALFTHLASARRAGAQVDVVLGDARLSLRDQPDGQLDLLVADAFSSDAIPLHLITEEAVRLYLDKLRPQGLLAFHVSNAHFDLRGILGAAARDIGVRSYYCRDWPPDGGWPPQWVGKEASTWVILARRDEDLRTIPRTPDAERWISYRPADSVRAWTDDYTNILAALD
jgi:SAM-dependent methyltransferase